MSRWPITPYYDPNQQPTAPRLMNICILLLMDIIILKCRIYYFSWFSFGSPLLCLVWKNININYLCNSIILIQIEQGSWRRGRWMTLWPERYYPLEATIIRQNAIIIFLVGVGDLLIVWWYFYWLINTIYWGGVLCYISGWNIKLDLNDHDNHALLLNRSGHIFGWNPLLIYPALFETLTALSFSPLSVATEADLIVSSRVKRSPLFAHTGCRTFCLPCDHAAIWAWYPLS